MKNHDVYLYGMVLLTNSFLLQGDYPQPDTYGEIKTKYVLPGGETGTAATVLSSLGCNVILEGTHLGNLTYPRIIDFYKEKSVDTTLLYLDQTYDGLEDYVIIDRHSRTPFGTFGDFYTNGMKRWNAPAESEIVKSKVAGIDPWFEGKSLKVVSVCIENAIPYVTIDCPYDSEYNRNCYVNVLSNEFISTNYPDADREELFHQYIEHSDGLIIFTLGARDIMYGRKGNSNLPKHLTPFPVNVISTLGAGDSFKAGCIYGVLQNMSDDDIVRFAAATAACACTVFPLPLNPPTLGQVKNLLSTQ